jgi:hypothetical protein
MLAAAGTAIRAYMVKRKPTGWRVGSQESI